MVPLRIQKKQGNSLTLVLPEEAAAKLKLEEGDFLFLTEGPDGPQVSASDPEFQRKMDVARDLMRRYRNALRELAK